MYLNIENDNQVIKIRMGILFTVTALGFSICFVVVVVVSLLCKVL